MSPEQNKSLPSRRLLVNTIMYFIAENCDSFERVADSCPQFSQTSQKPVSRYLHLNLIALEVLIQRPD